MAQRFAYFAGSGDVDQNIDLVAQPRQIHEIAGDHHAFFPRQHRPRQGKIKIGDAENLNKRGGEQLLQQRRASFTSADDGDTEAVHGQIPGGAADPPSIGRRIGRGAYDGKMKPRRRLGAVRRGGYHTFMPDFSHEIALGGRVAGVDEVGRGPLAGPVVACACMLDRDRVPPALLAQLDDSKKLSAARRTALAAALRAAPGVRFALAAASTREIFARNILGATFLAMNRALARLPIPPDAALIDGNKSPPGAPCPTRPVVGGDGRSLSIAAASILAKELRDRLMVQLDRRHPGYGWAGNAGYPTAAHRAALARLGPTPHHRRGFGGVPM